MQAASVFSQRSLLRPAAPSATPDVRPTLLRLAVHQFLQFDEHSLEELETFGELVAGFLSESSADVIRETAEVLCAHPQLPDSLLGFFFKKGAGVVDPLICKSPAFDARWQTRVLKSGDMMLCALLARRHGLSSSTIDKLLSFEDPSVMAALLDNTGIELSNSALRHIIDMMLMEPKLIRRAMRRPESTHLSALDYFLDAPSDMRMEALEALVADLDYGAPWEEQSPQQRALCTALECAALSRQTDMVITLMGKALPLPAATVERLVNDDGYEPLALALKALGMPREGIERVLIFCHPNRCPAADHMIFLMDAVDRLPYAMARDLFGKMVGGDATAVSLHVSPLATHETSKAKTKVKTKTKAKASAKTAVKDVAAKGVAKSKSSATASLAKTKVSAQAASASVPMPTEPAAPAKAKTAAVNGKSQAKGVSEVKGKSKVNALTKKDKVASPSKKTKKRH